MMCQKKPTPKSAFDFEQEFQRLYIENIQALKRYLYLKIGVKHDAEDLAQEVFFQVWKKRGQIREIEKIKEYLYAASRNRVINYLHVKARIRLLPEIYLSRHGNCSDPILEKEIKIIWHEAIERLPKRQRAAYLLKEESVDRRTIARVLQISKNTVDVHLVHSQKKVRDYVGRKMEIVIDIKDIKIAA